MRQLILYIIFMLAMVLGSHGEMSAALQSAPVSKDRLEKVEHKQDKPDAQINEASTLAYMVCGNRPQRLSPSGNMYANSSSRLTDNKIRLLSYFLSAISSDCEPSRDESAPIHFDVASKYYVICLRHLLC